MSADVTISFGYSKVSQEMTIPVRRNAQKRTIVLVNNTNQALSSISISAYDSLFPSAVASSANDTNAVTGTINAGEYAVLSGDNHNILNMKLDQVLLKTTATVAPTTGTLDVYVLESSNL